MAKFFDWSPTILEAIRTRVPVEGCKLLAQELGLNLGTIWARAKKMGVETPSAKARSANKGILVDFFNGWDPLSAYYLGYVWADGHIRNYKNQRALVLQCKTTDEELIIGLRNILRSNHKIHHRGPLRLKSGHIGKPQTRIQITSRQLTENLIRRHGFTRDKSKQDIPFPIVPKEFLGPFLRGYLDGDGSVTKAKTSTTTIVVFYGGVTFLEEMKVVLLKQLPLSSNNVTDGGAKVTKTKKVAWGDKADLLKLYHFLYPPGDYPHLARKRSKLEQALGLAS